MQRVPRAVATLPPPRRAPAPFRLRRLPATRPAEPPPYGGRATWLALGAFALLIALHALTGSEVTYSVVTLGGVGCAVVGIRRADVSVRWPWWSFMGAGVLWTVSSALTDASGTSGDLSADRSLLPDLFAIPAYALFGLALGLLLRARRSERDRGAFLDGVMLAAGAGLLVNEILIQPTLLDTDGWIAARIVIALYPALSLCLFGMAARLAFGSGERSASFTLLMCGTISLFVGDIVFAFGEIGRIQVDQALLEVPYLIVPACIGASLLHPSIRLVDQRATRPTRGLGPVRLASVAAALLTPILLIAVHRQHALNRGVTVALCLVLVGAAVIRIAAAMRAQAMSEAALYHRATHDDLTGLASRALVVQRVEDVLASGHGVALLFLDLDQFKFVNDSMGHSVGDELLGIVAERLRASVRAPDLVGRISGDEFVVVSEDLDVEGAHALADRIRYALRQPFLLEEGEVFVSASVGVTVAEADRRGEASALIQEADTAMYRSKDAGRDTTTMFDSSMRDRVARRIEVERLLRHGIDRGDIEVWFQPIVTMPAGRPRGFEALVRWQVDGRMESPAEFIAVAEESGLIVPLGAFVLDEACRQLAWWRRTNPYAADMYVSVNLSPRQVWSADIVELVSDTLTRYGLPGEALWLEITESVMMEDSVTTTAVLSELRTLGVRLAVDDFGTGFSSLSYLKRFPVSRVKIDRSFVGGLGEQEADTSLVAAIIAMASALALEPVAEGVETREQAQRLVDLGCAMGQGYLYGAAVPAAQVPAALAAMSAASTRGAVRARRCAPIARA